jgi:hypothetical protein
MKNLLVAASISLISTFSVAGEFIVHIGSTHSVKQYNLDGVKDVNINNNNYGVGYRNDDGLAVGTYFNSYHKQTAYITQDFMYNDYVGLVAGAVSGYKESTGLVITPMVAATVKIPLTKTMTANFLVMPKVGKLAGVAHLAISYKF